MRTNCRNSAYVLFVAFSRRSAFLREGSSIPKRRPYKTLQCDYKILAGVTHLQVQIHCLSDAHEQIDHAIAAALRQRLPVYINICCNVAGEVRNFTIHLCASALHVCVVQVLITSFATSASFDSRLHCTGES